MIKMMIMIIIGDFDMPDLLDLINSDNQTYHLRQQPKSIHIISSPSLSLLHHCHHHFTNITLLDKHQVMESYQDEKIIGEKVSDEDEKGEVDEGKIAKDEL